MLDKYEIQSFVAMEVRECMLAAILTLAIFWWKTGTTLAMQQFSKIIYHLNILFGHPAYKHTCTMYMMHK